MTKIEFIRFTNVYNLKEFIISFLYKRSVKPIKIMINIGGTIA